MHTTDFLLFFVLLGPFAFFLVVRVRPKILQFDDILVISSGFRSQLFCLWFAGRRIVVDPRPRTVTTTYRRFWFFSTSRRIEFDWVQQVLYRGNFLLSVNTSRGPRVEPSSFLDIYSVQLRLKNGEVVTIYRFAGDLFNEGEPLMLADLLCGAIGVPMNFPAD